MSENISDMGKKIVTQAQSVPNKMNSKRLTPKHIAISWQMFRTKRILKAARERKKVTYKGSSIRLSNDFLTETHQDRKKWKEIYKVMQTKGLNPIILYPEKLPFKIEREIRSFTYKQTNKQKTTQKNKTKN
uniref:Uncharacterized protein n=1 Tax=Pipistrellus kuhlii TaxID=59472 RepID=A0A7J8B2C8_PIPKU|nr:hypothetical protein mPipKuh1_007864 [Pipistrellus kuhlii]